MSKEHKGKKKTRERKLKGRKKKKEKKDECRRST